MTTDHQLLDPELSVLRTLGLRGRADAATLEDLTGLPAPVVADVLAQGRAREHVKEGKGAFRLAPSGRARVAELLDAERPSVDAGRLQQLYERFHVPNSRLKQLMTDWQLREGQPNDHADRAYDDGVADRVVGLHGEVEGLAAEIAAAAPRLARYPQRLRRAAERIGAGDHDFVAKPLMDSFHTVWFELHEELIGLLGLRREDEAAAGRAL